jgi:hypothetical protein
MSYVVEQTVKGHTYLYNVESFWDKDKKQSRQRRTYIGKKEPRSGSLIPPDNTTDAREFGATFFLQSIVGHLGLTTLLASIFPDTSREILALAFYRLCEHKALYLCEHWLDSVWLPLPLSLPSPRISELLVQTGHTSACRERFFKKWACRRLKSSRFVVFDITSVSSYAQGIDQVEWGYNRDHEALPQINLGVVYGEPSALPLCYRMYPGSIHDVNTLRNAVMELEVLSGGRALFILDKGFYSQANLRRLEGMDFIIPLPVRTCVYRDLVLEVRGQIRSAGYAIRHGEQVYYAMRKKAALGGGGFTAHIYLDQKRQNGEGESFLRGLLEGEALVRSEGFTDKSRLEAYLADQMPGFMPYFKIRKQGTTYVLHRRVEKIDAALSGMGIFVLITNSQRSSERVLDYYRERDGVEKCFDCLKNNLFLKRLRVHSGDGVEGLLFIEFIALIIRSHIAKVLRETKSLKSLYIPELLSELRKLKQIRIGKKKVLTEISKRQKDIFTAFGIDPRLLTWL